MIRVSDQVTSKIGNKNRLQQPKALSCLCLSNLDVCKNFYFRYIFPFFVEPFSVKYIQPPANQAYAKSLFAASLISAFIVVIIAPK